MTVKVGTCPANVSVKDSVLGSQWVPRIPCQEGGHWETANGENSYESEDEKWDGDQDREEAGGLYVDERHEELWESSSVPEARFGTGGESLTAEGRLAN